MGAGDMATGAVAGVAVCALVAAERLRVRP